MGRYNFENRHNIDNFSSVLQRKNVSNPPPAKTCVCDYKKDSENTHKSPAAAPSLINVSNTDKRDRVIDILNVPTDKSVEAPIGDKKISEWTQPRYLLKKSKSASKSKSLITGKKLRPHPCVLWKNDINIT